MEGENQMPLEQVKDAEEEQAAPGRRGRKRKHVEPEEVGYNKPHDLKCILKTDCILYYYR